MLDNSDPINVVVVCTCVVQFLSCILTFLFFVCTEVYIAFMLHNVDAGKFFLKLLCS